MTEVKIGIPKKDLTSSIEKLTVVLSNEMLLYVKTRKFHWNVGGNSFMELHKLFEAQYSDLEQTIDEVAERITKLGGKAIGTMKEFIENGTIKESMKYDKQDVMIKELLSDHESILKEMRGFIKDIEETDDFGTADFLTGILQKHEAKAWILRKYVS